MMIRFSLIWLSLSLIPRVVIADEPLRATIDRERSPVTDDSIHRDNKNDISDLARHRGIEKVIL